MKTKPQSKHMKHNKGLEARPELLSTASADAAARPQIDLALRRENRSLETEQLLALLRKDHARLYELAEVVGKWVWITFPEKQSLEVTTVLSQLGFHWNNARQSWQHPCGTMQEREERPQYDPRKRYGSHFAADQKAA